MCTHDGIFRYDCSSCSVGHGVVGYGLAGDRIRTSPSMTSCHNPGVLKIYASNILYVASNILYVGLKSFPGTLVLHT